MPKFGRKVPTVDATRIPVSRSKGQRSGSPGPLMLTHIVRQSSERQGLRTSNVIYGWRTTTRISHRRHDLQGQKSKSQSRDQSEPCAQWPINRKRIVVVSPKLAGWYPMTRATFRTSFKVKRSKVRVIDRLTQTHRMCHIFRKVRPKHLKVCVRMKDVDPHQRQAP